MAFVDSAEKEKSEEATGEVNSTSENHVSVPAIENETESATMVPAFDYSRDDESSEGESSVMSASAMPTYSSGANETSAVMSASGARPNDEKQGASSKADASSTGSPLTTPNFHSGDSDPSSGSDSAGELFIANLGKKKQSSNYRFKRGALISGTTDVSEQGDNFDGAESTDDIESGPLGSPNRYPRASRSLWHEASHGSNFSRNMEAEGVIQDAPASPDEQKKPHDNNVKSFIHRYRAAFAVIAILLIVIVIVVIVTSGDGGGGNSDAVQNEGISMVEMYEKIKRVVGQIVAAETLSDSTSAESQALAWLVEADTVWTHKHEDFSEARIVQRFTLVAFYIAMGGTFWEPNNWLQGDECGDKTWKFISCNENGEVHAMAFDHVGLAGQIPSFIQNLGQVENLIIKKEQNVTGQIPPEIGHLEKLRQLGLYYTGLSGTIPKEIFKATSLSFLNLQNNNLEGGIPTEIINLVGLEIMVLMNNKLGGELPWQTLAATGTRFLGLSNNAFYGIIPEIISDFATLEHLYLDGNDFGGQLPSAIGKLNGLKSLNLDGNNIRGPLPTEIGLLSNLQYFSMQYNELTGPLPGEMRNMIAVETVALGSNNFTGWLPDMGTLLNLENLYLFENQLSGPIPSYLFELESLKILFLSSNAFEGGLPLPDTINTNLIGLYVSDNNLNGEITDSLCNLRSLQALYLDENSFSGSIPECMDVIEDLAHLFAFKNQLTGFIPFELSSLVKLEKIGLEGNNLIGQVPDGLCRTVRDREIDFWSDCGGDDPELDCDCCSMCCTEPDVCTEEN